MKPSIVGAAAAAFSAVALATAAGASADSDEENFLKTLEAGGFSSADEAGRQAFIDLGYDICGGLDSGTSAADIITEGAEETGWTPTQVGFFVGAAASQFCPQHLQRAMEEAKTLGG